MKRRLLIAAALCMTVLAPIGLLYSQIINPESGFETATPGVHTGTEVAGWTMLADGGSIATFEIVNDPGLAHSGNQLLKVTVDALGTNPWEPQVFNTDFPITSNTTYQVSAWIASEVEGVQAAFTAGSLSPNYYEWSRKGTGALPLLSWTNVTFQFTTRAAETEPRAGIPIHFGAPDNSQFLPFTLYLDDIEVTVVTTGIKDQLSSLPKNYSLSQNYPNPFNPTTAIDYQLPKSGHVSLKVYDMLGNEIATLVNENKEAGSYTANFNAGNISSGVYFYTLQASGYTMTKKLVVLK